MSGQLQDSVIQTFSSPDDIDFKILNGVYTEPPCMAGVPERKITEQDTYWNPAWTKFKRIKQDNKHREFQGFGNTQCLEESDFPIHPNQILSKKYVIGKGLVNHNYLNPLRQQLSTLERSGLTAEQSVQWLPQRFAQAIRELEKQGQQFFLRWRIVNFHRDDKSYITILAKNPNISLPSFRRKDSGK
jgi:hypothetical protein